MLDELELQEQELKRKRKNAELKTTSQAIQQAFEPLEEKVEELNDNLKNLLTFVNKKPQETTSPDYFDKGLSEKVTNGLSQVSLLIQKLKPLDLSPIKEIADSVNNRNSELIKQLTALANLKNDTSGYDNLFKQVMLMIQKNNEFLQKGIAGIDYTNQFSEIGAGIKELVNRPTSFNIKIERSSQYGSNLISSASIEPKTDKK